MNSKALNLTLKRKFVFSTLSPWIAMKCEPVEVFRGAWVIGEYLFPNFHLKSIEGSEQSVLMPLWTARFDLDLNWEIFPKIVRAVYFSV